MESAPEQVVEHKRQLLARRGLLLVAIIIPSFVIVDAFAVGRIPWGTLTVRVLWALVLVGVSARLPVADRRTFQGLIRFVAGASALALAVIVQLSGGSQTMLFSVLPVLPLAVVVLTQDDGAAAWVTSVIIVVAMVWILAMENAPWGTIAGWALFTFGMSLCAALGAGLYRKRERMTLEVERARFSAVEKLAEMERRRGESERLALLGQLAAGVAHEINNPLAFVKANLSFLAQEVPTGDPEICDAISEAARGVERIEQIVRDLRGFSRRDSDEEETFDLSVLVNEALRIASVRTKGITKTCCELPPDLPQLRGARGRLLQVLVNLLVNAADALETAPDRPTDALIRVHAWREGDAVLLAVEDNGPGLPPAVLARAFEPFFTTKPPGKGTGLGLALSREYIERFGGTLNASNRPEGGAQLLIRLPLPAVQSALPVAATAH